MAGLLSRYFSLYSLLNLKLNLRKACNITFFFVPCIFLSQIHKKITQTIVVLPKGFHVVLRSTKHVYWNTSLLSVQSAWSRRSEPISLKNVTHLDAEHFRGKRLLTKRTVLNRISKQWVHFLKLVVLYKRVILKQDTLGCLQFIGGFLSVPVHRAFM